MGALTAVVALIFSLKDCEIPRRPNRVEVEEPELLKASLKLMKVLVNFLSDFILI